MTAKFTSKEELNDIAESLPSDFFALSDAMQEFKEKGITISFGRKWKRINIKRR